MSLELIKELDELYMKLEVNLSFFSPRHEKVIVDVYQAMGGIEGGGLVSFWSAYIPQKRMIKSFRILGEHEIADILAESKWIKKSAQSGQKVTREEYSDFNTLNTELWNNLKGVPSKLIKYAKKQNLL